MQPQPSAEPNIEMLAAAFLAGEGKTQDEIAAMLRISQAAVSRLLGQAKKDYLRKETRFLKEKLDEATIRKVVQRTGRGRLSQALHRLAQAGGSPRGPALRVFPSDAKSDFDRRRAQVARQAAPYVRELVSNSRCCGVAWGGMLREVVDALRQLSAPGPWGPAQTRIDCIPLSGEPLGKNPTRFSSSNLAHDLDRLANGEAGNPPSLAMVPAFVPEGGPGRFSKGEIRGVWRLIEMVPSYKGIFGDHRRPGDAMAWNLDMILTSVGRPDKPLGYGKGALFESGRVTIQELQQLILGDMGGVCFARPDLDKRQRARLKSVTDRWTGLQEQQVQRCAAKAFAEDTPKGPPGVVVISVGSDRASFICDAIARGIINHLIVDDELAGGIEEVLLRKSPDLMGDSRLGTESRSNDGPRCLPDHRVVAAQE